MNGIRKSIGALAFSLLLGTLAQAQTTLSSDNNPSLVLLIWDPVAKVSYSHDTGLFGSTLFNNPQANAGSQQFWALDPSTDPSFAQFLQATGDLADDTWLVIGGGKAASGNNTGQQVIYTTMANTTANGVLNPQWDSLVGVTNSQLRSKTGAFSTSIYSPLMGGSGPYNNYASAAPGTASSFDTSTSTAYLGNMSLVLSSRETLDGPGDALFGTSGFNTGNLLGEGGSSSWFYYLTPSSIRGGVNDKIIVSAFANSAYNAYWGLARTTNEAGQQELVLSFTQQAAITLPTSAAGILRRNQTDYAAQYGSVLPIANPAGEFAGWTPPAPAISAVPEPGSWVLMALGLGGVLAAGARRRRTG